MFRLDDNELQKLVSCIDEGNPPSAPYIHYGCSDCTGGCTLSCRGTGQLRT